MTTNARSESGSVAIPLIPRSVQAMPGYSVGLGRVLGQTQPLRLGRFFPGVLPVSAISGTGPSTLGGPVHVAQLTAP